MTEPESKLMIKFRAVSTDLLAWPTPGCEHVVDGIDVYACMCCDVAPRCEACHLRHHLPDTCPLCGAQLDEEIQHAVIHRYDNEGRSLRDDTKPSARILYAFVCGSCAIDNDASNL